MVNPDNLRDIILRLTLISTISSDLEPTSSGAASASWRNRSREIDVPL